MSQWARKYSDAQRAAVERAYCELRWKPPRIVLAAAAGELQEVDGADPLEPFTIPKSTVLSYGKRAARRKAGELRPDLAKLPPADRAQALQDRLHGLIDHELNRLERERARRPNDVLDAEQIRKLARAIREAAAFSDPSSKRLARAPGERDANGIQPESTTRDNLSGSLLRAARSHNPRPANDAPTAREHNGTAGNSDNDSGDSHDNDDSTAPQHDERQHSQDGDGEGRPCLPSGERDATDAGLLASGVVVSSAPSALTE